MLGSGDRNGSPASKPKAERWRPRSPRSRPKAVTRRGGVIGIPGVQAGFVHAFVIGDAFDKSIALTMGQIHVQKLMQRLLQYIEDGELQPDIIISRHMALADAARGCANGSRTCLRAGLRRGIMAPGCPHEVICAYCRPTPSFGHALAHVAKPTFSVSKCLPSAAPPCSGSVVPPW